jgi:hypothetical protein
MSHSRLCWARIEAHGVAFSLLAAKCTNLSSRCDAVDIDGRGPVRPGQDPTLSWGALWGVNITSADAVDGTLWKYFCDGGCEPSGKDRTSVCRGDVQAGLANVCYSKLACK